MRHLDFEQHVGFIDDTSEPFQGAVVIDGTGHANLDLGCPLQGVRVCLHDYHHPEHQLACDFTNALGEYNIPAVVGLRVGINATYFEHDVRPLDESRHVGGFLIQDDQVIDGVDFADVEKEEMVVEVVGGLCNRRLGTVELAVKRASCPSWEGQCFAPRCARGMRVMRALQRLLPYTTRDTLFVSLCCLSRTSLSRSLQF